jgi:hypothetical protein
MNQRRAQEHPSEERLIEFAINGQNDREIAGHCASCATCNAVVNELRAVKDTITSSDDCEIPERVKKNIFTITHKKPEYISYLNNSLLQWYKNPVLMALGVVAIVVAIAVWLIIFL